MKHLIVVETPDNEYAPSSNPTTHEVIQKLLRDRDEGTWWMREARIYEVSNQELKR